MADKELTVEKDALYMLRWTVPAVPQVTTSFVDPDGTTQDFHHPDPVAEGETPTVIKITLKMGESEEKAEPERFRAGRTKPAVITRTVTNSKQEKKSVLVFSAIFKAREEGVYLFTVEGGPDNKSIVQKMTVTPPTPVYNSIQEVMDDPKAVRRQAVLAAAADFFPAFNTCTLGDEGPKDALTHKKADQATHQAKAAIGSPCGVMDQGSWVHSYGFCSKTPGTSCTTVNPLVVTPALCPSPAKTKECPSHAKHRYWSFDAEKNPGWVVASRVKIPSVGDTYLLNNGWTAYTGHVGLILHVPPDGNGLWVTADGGQGTKPSQLGLIIPRWGLMGAMLPEGGSPQGSYKKMIPGEEDGPFLSGATGGEIDVNAPVPNQNDDVPGIIKRIRFRQTDKPDAVSNPRRIAGFVNVDSPAIETKVDGTTSTPEILAKCQALKERVDRVIAATLKGGVVGGAST